MTNHSSSTSSIIRLASLDPSPVTPGASPPHHVAPTPGAAPTSFRNPWPSAKPQPLSAVLYNRLFRRSDRNFVPIPANREGLVKVRQPDWGVEDDISGEKLKATWIGHASWLVEFPVAHDRRAASENGTDPSLKETSNTGRRGVRLLLDPVFAERTSPFSWAGPKRYTPTPCTVAELPEIDAVLISHNHYDHLDVETIKELWRKQDGKLKIFCGLGNKSWFLGLTGIQMNDEDVVEMDWWDAIAMKVDGIGSLRIVCTPAQHFSARGVMDRDKTLWCSFVFDQNVQEAKQPEKCDGLNRSLYFAGDTGYRHVPVPHPTPEEEAAQPACPAFKEVGDLLGPFDLALLPIGLCTPRDFMSTVHCSPEDAVCLHKDIRAKKSIGMHYGTVRGGISELYEDVLDPPRRFKELSEKAGLVWSEDVGLCDVGETVIV